MQPAGSSGSWSGSSRQLKLLLSPFRNRIYRQLRKKLIVDFFRLRSSPGGCSSHRTGLHGFPSTREKNREYCKFDGVATTCPRTNTRNFRRLSAKFPVRIEPRILFIEQEIIFIDLEFTNAKKGNGRTRMHTNCLVPAGNRTAPAMHGTCLLEETGG